MASLLSICYNSYILIPEGVVCMEYPREKVCCFTGHRRLPAAKIDGIKRRAEERIRTLYADGVRVFCVGGAVGFDTIIAELLFRLRETELTELNVVLCYPFDGFTENWMDGQKAAYAALLPKYDDVRRVSETGGMDAFSARNRQMVDMAAYCIAYCSNKKRSGTAQTIHYAEEQGLTIWNIA